MGWVFKESGKLDEAVKYFEIALEKEPNLAEAHVNLGQIEDSSGKLAQAVAHYEQAVKFKPN
jgi:tetratricopeptide (TPR) repeat protein